MADNPQTLTAVLNALAQNFRPTVVRQFNRRSVLLSLLPIVKGVGKNIAFDIEGSGIVAEGFNDGDDVTNYGSDALQPGTINWAQVRSNFRVGDIAAAAASSSGSPADLLSLLGRNVQNAAAAVASNLNAQFYNGNGSAPNATGLDIALRDDNTYATIDRTSGSNSYFRGNKIDPGVLTDVQLTDIRKDITQTIYTACGEYPDIALCSPAVYNKLAAKFEETRRRNDDIRNVTTARGQVTLSASVGALEFEGCYFFRDKDATANRIYYLNSNYVSIEYLPQPMADIAMAEAAMDVALNDGFGQIPLGMKFLALGRTGSSRKATCQVIANLKVQRPNACGLRLNVLDV